MKKQFVVMIILVWSSIPTHALADTGLTKPWSILGYFDGENAELERICEYNINQLEEADSPFANISAVYDRPYKKTRDSTVRIYDIKKDNDRNRIHSQSISMGERDMGDPEVLDEFLSGYLGNKNILIVKSHGWGIIPGFSRVGYNSPQDPLLISNVLKKRLKKPLELLIFDSCNMASVEVAYQFKGLVSVMVASQDLMHYSMDAATHYTYSSRPGIDYEGLVSKLRPNSNAITIGKDVVNDFIEIISNKDAMYYKSTMSATDLKSLDIDLFKIHAQTLIKGLESEKTRDDYLFALKFTLDNANHFKPLGRYRLMTYYDVVDFFSTLESVLKTPFEIPRLGIIQSYSNNFIRKASGLSVLFFKDLSRISEQRKQNMYDKYSASRFAMDTGWDRLIETYHRFADTYN